MDAVLTLPATREGALARPRSWRILVRDGNTAHEQMAIDDALARDAQPTLRLFRWMRPAFSLGRNQIRPEWLDGARLANAGVELVERPTGGGLALHGSDLSCSVVVPHEPGLRLSSLMAWICQTLTQAFRDAGYPVEWIGELPATLRVIYCLAQPSSYALYVGGKKFGGFAIRRYTRSLLVQGSCALHPFPEALMRVMSEEAAYRYATQSAWLEMVSPAPVDDEAVIHSILRTWRAS